MAETKGRKISRSYNPNATVNATKIEEKSNPGVEKLTAVETTAVGANDGVSDLENEIGLINFNRLVDNSAAVDNFVNGFSDAFEDQTGVDTDSSTHEYVSASNIYQAPQNKSLTEAADDNSLWSGVTGSWTFGAYSGSGVTSTVSGGNIRSTIYTTTASSETGDIVSFSPQSTSSVSGAICIYEASSQSFIQPSNGNYYGGGLFSSSSSHWVSNPSGVNAVGVWLSNGNIWTANPAADASSTDGITAALGSTYTLNRASDGTITMKVDGVTNSAYSDNWTKQITGDWRVFIHSTGEGNHPKLDSFKIKQADGTFNSGTFKTVSQTVSSAPDSIRLVVIGKEESSQTLNTDTVFSVSRDGGTTFTNVTLSDSGNYNSSGVKIYVGSADVSGQPSGTNIKFKMTSSSNKGFTLHGYSLIYK